jgi:hypothetical protein
MDRISDSAPEVTGRNGLIAFAAKKGPEGKKGFVLTG